MREGIDWIGGDRTDGLGFGGLVGVWKNNAWMFLSCVVCRCFMFFLFIFCWEEFGFVLFFRVLLLFRFALTSTKNDDDMRAMF